MKRIVFYTLLLSLFFADLGAKEKRDLFSGSYHQEEIAACLAKDFSWVPFPVYQERQEWEKIPGTLREAYIKAGEAFLDYNWPAIPASSYLAYVRDGNRNIMQKPYNERHRALQALAMAELIEGKGRFLDQLINGVWVCCEMTYWGLSAHLTLQKAGSGLPDVEEPTIDLGAGKLGTDLAWIHYFFKDAFDKVNPLISTRIEREITEKILKPYYERDDFWWQGFKSSFVNNWNPWCNYNVLNCLMLIEKDQKVKEQTVLKILSSLDKFINYYHEDGGCEEGPAYWSHAGGKLFDDLELLHRISGGEIDIYGETVVANIGRYIYRAHIDGPFFINFADASARIHSRPGIIYRYGKRIKDEKMMGFGAFLAQEQEWGKKPLTGKIELALENLFQMDEVLSHKAQAPKIKDFWLPGTQLMGARDKEGRSEGFFLAAKGGHNGESHNHNDVGSCILYVDGKPALVDAGVGTYTRKTFSSKRYEIWTMQSGYHNLPAINGIDQKDGANFKAGAIKYNSSSMKAFFSVDMASAYPKEAGVEKWQRSYILNRGRKVTIQDEYQLKENNGKTIINLLSCCQVEKEKEGSVILKGDGFSLRVKYDPLLLEFGVEKKTVKDPRLTKVWGDNLSRIRLKLKDSNLKGKVKVDIYKI